MLQGLGIRSLPILRPASSWPSLRVRRSLHIDSTEELFSVTRVGWILEDEKNRKLRHVPFNVQEMMNAGVQAAGAKQCTSFTKVTEDSCNRIFRLKFDNNTELFAQVPFHLKGPKHYMTASEVATMDFLRTECDIPTPRVRAWCSRAEESPVGVEFILYERLPGIPLEVHNLRGLPAAADDAYLSVLPDIQRIHSKLFRRAFSQIGSIYYKEDVSEELRARSLYPGKEAMTLNAERFRIGPTVDRQFWRSGRARLDLDRGPWLDCHAYQRALASCAKQAADLTDNSSTREEWHRLISQFEVLVPHLLPPKIPFTLGHPGLSDGVITVSETTNPCTFGGVVGWQGATVAPYILQEGVPPAYESGWNPLVEYDYESGEPPQFLPGIDIDRLPAVLKRQSELAIRSIERNAVYRNLTRQKDPELYETLWGEDNVEMMNFARCPITLITAVDEAGLEQVHLSFTGTYLAWNFVVGGDEAGRPLEPYPLPAPKYGAREMQQVIEAVENSLINSDNGAMRSFGLEREADDAIPIDQFNAAKEAMAQTKSIVLREGPTQGRKDWVEELRSIGEGGNSICADLCY